MLLTIKQSSGKLISDFYNNSHDVTVDVALLIDGEKYLTNCNSSQCCRFDRRTNLNFHRELKIDKLSFNTKVSISLKLYDGLDEEMYIGTTTLDLFDNQLKLRTGNFFLIFWPFTPPDFTNENSTPGEVDEMFYEHILNNYFAQLDKNPHLSLFHQSKGIEACLNQNFTLNQTCILPFIEINIGLVEPKTTNLIYLDHPVGIRGIQNEMKDLIVKNTQSPAYQFFVKENTYNALFMENPATGSILEVRDWNYDLDREDPVAMMYLGNFDDDKVENLKPSSEEVVELHAIIKKPNFSVFTPEEKDKVWTFRYYLRSYPDALPKFLISTNWMIEKNITEGLKFLEMWKQIEYDDALFLLSHIFCANELYTSE